MISFVSGIYDVDTIPPYKTKKYDVTELPIAAESDLTLEEKLDIIFNLSGYEKQKYLSYIHKLANYKGEHRTLKRLAAVPEFTQIRNQFIYDRLDGTPDRFIKGIINKHYNKLLDCEGLTYTDLIQEGWIALIRLAKEFIKEGRIQNDDVKFSTAAYSRVEGHIRHIFRDEFKIRDAESEYDQDKFETSIEKEAFTVHKKEQLSEQEQMILELYANGYTQEEIKEKLDLDMTRRNVGHKLNDIKNRFSKNTSNLD